MYPRSMTAAPEPLVRLALYVERRIDELALEYAEVSRRADISDETLIKIRKGMKARGSTYRKLERALHWRQGSMAAILAGGEPSVPDVDMATRRRTDERVEELQAELQAELVKMSPEDRERWLAEMAQEEVERLERWRRLIGGESPISD
jgi:hypothetical protein